MSRARVPATPSYAATRLSERRIDYGLADRALVIDAVIQIAGLGRSMIYRKVRQGTFPKPFKPGGASSRWSEREVMDWLEEVKAARIV